ncbi:ABC transporter substrate-binding protein [Microbacterium sp. GXF0217]
MSGKRNIGAVVATVAAGALLAGCAQGGDSGGDEDVTLTWWATNQAATIEQDLEIYQPIADKFTEETGIKVEIEITPWSDYYNKILGAVSSGTGPDVMSIGTTWTPTLASTGAFVQLDESKMNDLGGADKFVDASLAAAGGADEGGPSFLPLMNTVNTLFYSPSMFEAAGIDGPPETWDEFVEDGQKLTQDTNGDGSPDVWGFGFSAGYPTELSHVIFALGRQYGGEMFDADDRGTLDSDGLVAATKEMTDWMTVDQVMASGDVDNQNQTPVYQSMADGRVAMLIGGNPLPAFEAAGFTDFAAAPVPLADPLVGDPIMSHVAGANIGVFGASPHTEQALQFVKYLTDESAQIALANEQGILPVNADAYASPDIEKDAVFEARETVITEHADTFPLTPKTAQAETLVGDAIKQLFSEAALSGTVTEDQIRAVLKEANSQLNAAG